MSHNILEQLVIEDDEGTTLVVKPRVIEDESLLTFTINGATIYLSSQSDLDALIKFTNRFINRDVNELLAKKD